MGYLPLAPGGQHQGVRGYRSQLFFIDSSYHPNTGGAPIAGSLRGYKYYLPPLNQLGPVVKVVAHTGVTLPRSIQGATDTVAVPGDYAHWMITLRQPDGLFIVEDSPLQGYVPTGTLVGPGGFWPRYFNPVVFPDPLQSYVVCTLDALPTLLALEFWYR